MKQTFLKSIDGFDLEFNKLLYPTRYQVVLKRPNRNPVIVTFNKSSDDEWMLADRDVEDFGDIEPILGEVTEAIYDNESVGVVV